MLLEGNGSTVSTEKKNLSWRSLVRLIQLSYPARLWLCFLFLLELYSMTQNRSPKGSPSTRAPGSDITTSVLYLSFFDLRLFSSII